MTGIFTSAGREMRQQQDRSSPRQSVEHLDARPLRDAGLETYAADRMSRPFWWLWRRGPRD